MVAKNLIESVSKALTIEEIEQCKQFAKALFECDINLDRTNIIVIILLVIKNNKNIINDIDKENVLNVIVLSFIDIYHFENLQSLKNMLPSNYKCYNKYLTLFYDICVFVKSCVDKYGNDILIKIYEAIDIYDSFNRLKGNNESTYILFGEDVCDMMVNRTFDYYYKLNGYKNDIEYVDFCVDDWTLSRVSKFTSNYSVCNDFINIKNNIYYYKMLLDGLIPDRFKDSINDDGNYDISIIKLNRFKKDNNYDNTACEYHQIMKQIKLLKVGGIGSFMIPWYHIYDNSPECITFRTELLKNVKILSCYTVYDNLLKFIRDKQGFFINTRPIIACCMIIYQKIEKIDNPVKQVINDSANYLYCGYSHSDIENIKRNYPHNESKFTIDIKDNIMIDYYYPSVINKVNGEIKTKEQFKTALIDNIRSKINKVVDTYFKPSNNDNSDVDFTNKIIKALDINNIKVYKWGEYQIKKIIKLHNMYHKKHCYDEFNDSENDSDNESNNSDSYSESDSDSDSDDELIETIEILFEHKFGSYDWEVIKNHLNDYIKYPLTCWCNTD